MSDLGIPRVDYHYILLMSDQPTTCPKCGARTDLLADLSHTNAGIQIEQCLNDGCGWVFLVGEE
jgi:predicted RNA-binding Zn ribbon-like protein